MTATEEKMKLQIAVATGIEAAVKREILRMGLGHAPAIRGGIQSPVSMSFCAAASAF